MKVCFKKRLNMQPPRTEHLCGVSFCLYSAERRDAQEGQSEGRKETTPSVSLIKRLGRSSKLNPGNGFQR